MSNCERDTPTSSLEPVASRCTRSGASPASGVAVKAARGAPVSFIGAATAMVVCAESRFPAASRTVSWTRYDPALAKRWSSEGPLAVAPSPRSQEYAVIPVSSVDTPASKWTVSGATPLSGEA